MELFLNISSLIDWFLKSVKEDLFIEDSFKFFLDCWVLFILLKLLFLFNSILLWFSFKISKSLINKKDEDIFSRLFGKKFDSFWSDEKLFNKSFKLEKYFSGSMSIFCFEEKFELILLLVSLFFSFKETKY